MKEQREIQAGDTCVACGVAVRASDEPGSVGPVDGGTSSAWSCDCDSGLGPQVAVEDPDGD